VLHLAAPVAGDSRVFAGDSWVWAQRASAIPFQGWLIWQVSCYKNSLVNSNFNSHHHPAVYITQHLFWGLMSVGIGRLNPAFGSSPSASSAYQKWPTRQLAFHTRPQASELGFLPI